jgi:hypothetical protein
MSGNKLNEGSKKISTMKIIKKLIKESEEDTHKKWKDILYSQMVKNVKMFLPLQPA